MKILTWHTGDSKNQRETGKTTKVSKYPFHSCESCRNLEQNIQFCILYFREQSSQWGNQIISPWLQCVANMAPHTWSSDLGLCGKSSKASLGAGLQVASYSTSHACSNLVSPRYVSTCDIRHAGLSRTHESNALYCVQQQTRSQPQWVNFSKNNQCIDKPGLTCA